MNTPSAYCLIIISTIIIDILARWAEKTPYREENSKPAGLLSLLVLCLINGNNCYWKKSVIIKQYFLSLAVIIFLGVANYLLLIVGAPTNANVFGFLLLVTPILTMPFFHFLYNLIGIEPLSIDELLRSFRIRGAIALIISANTIFMALLPLEHVIGLLIHFALALFALNGLFFLCASLRRKTSIYQAPLQNIEYGLPSMTFYYVASILEVLYFLLLINDVFLKTAFEIFFARIVDPFGFVLSLAFLLIFTALLNKIRYLFGRTISVEIYEEKALPVSFFIFGLLSIIRYYF